MTQYSFLRYSGLSKIDGVSLWSSLSEDGTFERSEILHNIDDIFGSAALTVGQWKIVKGNSVFLWQGRSVTYTPNVSMAYALHQILLLN